jgi:hypothetical protein
VPFLFTGESQGVTALLHHLIALGCCDLRPRWEDVLQRLRLQAKGDIQFFIQIPNRFCQFLYASVNVIKENHMMMMLIAWIIWALQGDFKDMDDKKHRAVYETLVDPNKKLQYFGYRLIGSRGYLCHKVMCSFRASLRCHVECTNLRFNSLLI